MILNVNFLKRLKSIKKGGTIMEIVETKCEKLIL